jgi:hypothetical protein
MTITPTLRNKAKQALPKGQEKTRAQKHQSMIWVQILKRFFGIEIETCEQCGGAVKVIARLLRQIGRKADLHSGCCPSTKSSTASDKSV